MFSKWFNKKTKKVNLELEREYVPFFSGSITLKNREFREVEISVEGFKEDLEKQGPEYIEVSEGFMDPNSKGFGIHYGDPDFEIEGFKQGEKIKKINGGYMDNITSYYTVVLVTNKHVFMSGEHNSITVYSHSELETLTKHGDLKKSS